MKTELLYFDDCPSYKQALENLKRALQLERLPDEVDMIVVLTQPMHKPSGSSALHQSGLTASMSRGRTPRPVATHMGAVSIRATAAPWAGLRSTGFGRRSSANTTSEERHGGAGRRATGGSR